MATTANNGLDVVVQPKFCVSSGLLDVLKAEGAQSTLFTRMEIMDYLHSYICRRVLYDQQNPTLVHCENDLLGKALGVKQFTLSEVLKLLSTKVFLVATPQQKGHGEEIQMAASYSGAKRKSCDDMVEISVKRTCVEKEEQKNRWSPFFFETFNPPEYDSTPETVLSLQGYETAIVKDSSDDLWFLETESEHEGDFKVDEYDVEFEVTSLPSSDHGNISDTESEVAEFVEAAIIVCQNDSDVEFWADSEEDSTSESDLEITDCDKWMCAGCNSYNKPLLRFCQKCWRLRDGWLPEHRRHPKRFRRRRALRRTLSAPGESVETPLGFNELRRRKTSQSLLDVSVVEEADAKSLKQKTSLSSDLLGEHSQGDSQPGTSGLGSSETLSSGSHQATMCIMCLSRPKNASIVHGKTGHQMCCYPCGKKLWVLDKPCPICRRRIQKVIYNRIV